MPTDPRPAPPDAPPPGRGAALWRNLWPIALLVLALVAVRDSIGQPPAPPAPPVRCPEGCQPIPQPTPPTDPAAALVYLRMGESACTGTMIEPLTADGKGEILTAAHCIQLGQRGTARLSDGRVVAVTCKARDAKSDIAWVVTEVNALGKTPTAKLATENPVTRRPIWHKGFGIDKPGNKETGEFLGGPDQNGQMRYWISVSPGDSGGGMFELATGHVLSPVCCTTALARPGYVWGGSPRRAWALRPSGQPREMMKEPAALEPDQQGHPPDAIVPTLTLASMVDVEASLRPMKKGKDHK